MLGYAGEDLGALRGKLGEDLAVEREAALVQLADERAVGRVAVLADGGVQADDPELSERRLLVASVGKGVAAGAHERLVREVDLLGTDAAIALGALKDVLATLVCLEASFDSCHMRVIKTLS